MHEAWEKITEDFYSVWQFPDCLRALNSRPITIEKSVHSDVALPSPDNCGRHSSGIKLPDKYYTVDEQEYRAISDRACPLVQKRPLKIVPRRNARRPESDKKGKTTAADDRFITLLMLRNRTSMSVEARSQHREVSGVDINV
ncbi:hypothetical protein ILUMI_03810 [Ignelater luminosus]|uniref:Uncharacterized protein n=1 Tax=Ignelater luminosus TaxID=2038154 RepID=A0A8K0DFW1_IGNLU|nr:hypothetical protein ILUMI_03810 [Ignelater luminosus]